MSRWVYKHPFCLAFQLRAAIRRSGGKFFRRNLAFFSGSLPLPEKKAILTCAAGAGEVPDRRVRRSRSPLPIIWRKGSGSKLVSALEDVEFVELKINDSTQSKNSMWDVIESDEMTRSKLWIDIDYGLTGDFLLATKKSTLEWDDVIDFSNDGEEIVLSTGDTSLNMTYNSCTYGDLNYEVKESGNKLILSVTEKS